MSQGASTTQSAVPRASTLPIAGLDADAIERWRELGRRAVDPNPFFEPEFLIPAAELVGSAPDRLLVIEDDRGWRACLPLAQRRLRFLTRASEAGLARYGFLSTPLVAPEEAERSAALLIEAISGAPGAYPLLMPSLGASGPFFTALDDALASGSLRALEQQSYERALLVRGQDVDWTARLGRHHVRELRRMRRRLGEDLGGEVQCRERAGDPRAVETFLELELSGWKGRAGTAFASEPREAEFFRRVCSGFHAAGRLQLLDLGVGERSVAQKCNLIAGHGSFAFKIAFDENFSRWSPGIQLELENVELFNAGELTWMDSCAQPSNTMINRLWQWRRTLRTIVLADRSPRSRAAAAWLTLTRRLRDAKLGPAPVSPRTEPRAAR